MSDPRPLPEKVEKALNHLHGRLCQIPRQYHGGLCERDLNDARAAIREALDEERERKWHVRCYWCHDTADVDCFEHHKRLLPPDHAHPYRHPRCAPPPAGDLQERSRPRCRCNCHNGEMREMFPKEHDSCEICLDELLEEATAMGRVEGNYLANRRPPAGDKEAR